MLEDQNNLLSASARLKTCKLEGHPLVRASVNYANDTPVSMTLEIGHERVQEFKHALNRALNCTPEAPRWLFELADALDARP